MITTRIHIGAMMTSKNCCEDLVPVLEEAIDLIDKIESHLGRVKPGDKISPGELFLIASTLMNLREKVVEARMRAFEYCTCK